MSKVAIIVVITVKKGINMWEILGISKTNDIEAIKKAYAECVKDFHVEDDQEGFIRLQNAYREALRIARLSVFRNEDVVEDVEVIDFEHIEGKHKTKNENILFDQF